MIPPKWSMGLHFCYNKFTLLASSSSYSPFQIFLQSLSPVYFLLLILSPGLNLAKLANPNRILSLEVEVLYRPYIRSKKRRRISSLFLLLQIKNTTKNTKWSQFQLHNRAWGSTSVPRSSQLKLPTLKTGSVSRLGLSSACQVPLNFFFYINKNEVMGLEKFTPTSLLMHAIPLDGVHNFCMLFFAEELNWIG